MGRSSSSSSSSSSSRSSSSSSSSRSYSAPVQRVTINKTVYVAPVRQTTLVVQPVRPTLVVAPRPVIVHDHTTYIHHDQPVIVDGPAPALPVVVQPQAQPVPVYASQPDMHWLFYLLLVALGIAVVTAFIAVRSNRS